MQSRPANLITERLQGWTPSADAQQVIMWRVLQMFLSRYGSAPLGQLLVSMTTIVLNELGRAPTVTELCEATGLPKSSISRYISAQMEKGLIDESIDPQDRRRRMLRITEKGKADRRSQIQQLRKIMEDVCEWDQARAAGELESEDELEAMKTVARGEAKAPFSSRKRGSRTTA
jgi:DNA-binding MarR family transcriptional regulator